MKAYELLSDPSKWTKGASARGPRGESLPYNHSNAVSFCIIGAVAVCYQQDPEFFNAIDTVRTAVREKTGLRYTYEWHDDPATTHEEVVALLKELGI